MSTRGKILSGAIVAALFGGIAWFAVASAPPVVTMRFARYETNHYPENPRALRQMIFAVFVVTNGARHPILCLSNSGSATFQNGAAGAGPTAAGQTLSPAGLRRRQFQILLQPTPTAKALNPGEHGRIFMHVTDFQQPMRAWLEYEPLPAPGSFQHKWQRWLRGLNWQRSVSVTIHGDG